MKCEQDMTRYLSFLLVYLSKVKVSYVFKKFNRFFKERRESYEKG